jgi:sterol desaturase/sphingolipid hydroxylase (fatty acid hydroxylase superfamily)
MAFAWEKVADWFINPTFLSVGVSLLIFALTLGTLERLFHARGRRSHGPRSVLLDLCFWFFTPLVTKVVTMAVLLFVTAALIGISADELVNGQSARVPVIGAQPLWLQVLVVLLVGDFTHYWTHRLFHKSWLWPAHAVHHSPAELDWFSSMRMHPLNDVATRAFQGLPLFLLGFSLESVALGVPIAMLVVIVSHTNVPWTYGPLRYVVVSPVYHQWHHSSEPEAIDKNFAGIFPIWDLLFGTWYMPAGKLATRFGCKSDPPPEHLPGQLLYPLNVWLSPHRRAIMRGQLQENAGEAPGSSWLSPRQSQ